MIAKLIIEGELSQLLKIKKAQSMLELRKIVKCTIEEDKIQEEVKNPPESNQIHDQEVIKTDIQAVKVEEKKKGRPYKK